MTRELQLPLNLSVKLLANYSKHFKDLHVFIWLAPINFGMETMTANIYVVKSIKLEQMLAHRESARLTNNSSNKCNNHIQGERTEFLNG